MHREQSKPVGPESVRGAEAGSRSGGGAQVDRSLRAMSFTDGAELLTPRENQPVQKSGEDAQPAPTRPSSRERNRAHAAAMGNLRERAHVPNGQEATPDAQEARGHLRRNKRQDEIDNTVASDAASRADDPEGHDYRTLSDVLRALVDQGDEAGAAAIARSNGLQLEPLLADRPRAVPLEGTTPTQPPGGAPSGGAPSGGAPPGGGHAALEMPAVDPAAIAAGAAPPEHGARPLERSPEGYGAAATHEPSTPPSTRGPGTPSWEEPMNVPQAEAHYALLHTELVHRRAREAAAAGGGGGPLVSQYGVPAQESTGYATPGQVAPRRRIATQAGAAGSEATGVSTPETHEATLAATPEAPARPGVRAASERDTLPAAAPVHSDTLPAPAPQATEAAPARDVLPVVTHEESADTHDAASEAGAAGVGNVMSIGRGVSALTTLGEDASDGATVAERRSARASAVSDIAGAANSGATIGSEGGTTAPTGALSAGLGLGAAALQTGAGVDELGRGGHEAEGMQNIAGGGAGLANNTGALLDAAGATGAGRVMGQVGRGLGAGAGAIGVGRAALRYQEGDAENGVLDGIDATLQTAGAVGGPAAEMVTSTGQAALSLGRRGDAATRDLDLYHRTRVGRGVDGGSYEESMSASDAAAYRADQVRQQDGEVAGAVALVRNTGEAALVAAAAGTDNMLHGGVSGPRGTADIEATERVERGDEVPAESTDADADAHERQVRAHMRRLRAQRERRRQEKARAAAAAAAQRAAPSASGAAVVEGSTSSATGSDAGSQAATVNGHGGYHVNPGEVGVQIDNSSL